VARIRALIAGLALLCGVLAAQQAPPPKEQAPPEEDETLQPKEEYAFNPLQAEKDIKIGVFYFKKGSFKAAATRFLEATKWNPGLAESYFLLGEAEEKLKDRKAAHDAWAKFLELAPGDKRAEEVKKKLGQRN
jgi:tetratricopeptide (TPR) repeat protein